MILTFLLAWASLVSLGLAQPARPPGLHGCANHLAFNNTVVRLAGTTTFSQYIQCTYQQNHPDGSVGTHYCWYDYQTYLLYHYPNTPLPVDSHTACPNNLPLASIYRIRPSASSSKCITAMGESDGSPVQIQDCRPDIWRPEQVWHFNNDRIQPLATDKCLDVTDGNTNAGKLQIWTCEGTNPNQQFEHWVTNVVIVPEDHIRWKSQFQCLDLTNGVLTNGNQLQMWPCNYQNPNQLWFLEPVV
ncbi:hypothetical protein H1R20_g11181, partial [Candolleomyces eurysporus]